MPLKRAIPKTLMLTFVCPFLLPSPALAGPRQAQLLTTAQNLIAQHQYQKSISYSTEAIKEDSNDGEGYIWRGMAKTMLEPSADAAADLEKGLKLAPSKNFAVFYQLAQCYFAMEKYDQALTAIQRSISLKKSFFAYRLEGQTLWKMRRDKEALQSFTNAIAANPSFYWTYDDRAGCYEQLGRLQEALADRTKITKIAPEQVANYFSRAKIYDKLGKKDLAEADRKRATELSKQDFE